MTASQIFKSAHKIAKELGNSFGHYAVRLSYALKTVYAEMKNAISNVFKGNDEGDDYTVTVSDVRDDYKSDGYFKQVLVKLEICGDVEEYTYTHRYSENIDKWSGQHLGFINDAISNYIISLFK